MNNKWRIYAWLTTIDRIPARMECRMKIRLFPLLLLAGCIIVPAEQPLDEPPTKFITHDSAPATLRDQWKTMRQESEVNDISEPTATAKFLKMMETPATATAKRSLRTKTKTKTASSKKNDKPQAQTQEKPGSAPKPAAAAAPPPEPPKKAGP